MQNPVVVVKTINEPDKFEIECKRLIYEGYLLEYASCNSHGNGQIDEVYLAILVLPEVKNVTK